MEVEPIVSKAEATGFNVKDRLKSFRHALNGIRSLIILEHNARVHCAATLAVILTGIVCNVSANEWRWLALAIGLVWVTEAINTAIEALCDLVHPEFHPQIKLVKDLAAGAVLVAAVTALMIGASVFWPLFSRT